MGILDKLFSKENQNNLDASDIVAMSDGERMDVSSVTDTIFSQQLMGETIAFKYTEDKVTICSPATGRLVSLFPTGHAFGISMSNGVEILVHIGIDTVSSKGEGFKILNFKKNDFISAGDPVVEVAYKRLADNYDMSTMLVLLNKNDLNIKFKDDLFFKKGQSLLE